MDFTDEVDFFLQLDTYKTVYIINRRAIEDLF